MQRFLFVTLMVVGVLVNAAVAESVDRPAKETADDLFVTKVYTVADLVVPLPSSTTSAAVPVPSLEKEWAALEQHVRRVTGADVWKEEAVIKPFGKTYSLVVRQTAAVHNQIAEELNRLRQELDVQAVLSIHVLSGSRTEIAELAAAFPGELGQFETEQILKRSREFKTVHSVMAPRVTLFSRQTAQVLFDDRAITVHPVVSEDRRSIRLKVSEKPEKDGDLLGNVEIVQLHSGRSATVRFEAPRVGGNIPPAPDVSERLLVITANVVVVEEEEVPHKVVITVQPRIIVQQEEELQTLSPMD